MSSAVVESIHCGAWCIHFKITIGRRWEKRWFTVERRDGVPYVTYDHTRTGEKARLLRPACCVNIGLVDSSVHDNIIIIFSARTAAPCQSTIRVGLFTRAHADNFTRRA